MNEILAWLLEQVAEDERVATAAKNDLDAAPWWTYEHAASWDPARVLAECDAKRRIISLFTLPVGDTNLTDRETKARVLLDEHFPHPALLLLALPYSDRPGYRQEWLP
jgi:hypothetical protein